MVKDVFAPQWMQDTANKWWVRIGNNDPVLLVEPLEVIKEQQIAERSSRRAAAAASRVHKSLFKTPRK